MELLSYALQLEDIIGSGKVVLLGNFEREEDFDVFIENGASFIDHFCFLDEPGVLSDLKNNTSVFYLDTNYRIANLFIPELCPKYKEDYFVKFLPSLFKDPL
jgi:hypothetical protein